MSECVSNQVLQFLLQQSPDLLTIAEAGRLSICSKETMRMVDESGVWKKLVKGTPSLTSLRQGISWNGEDGLLPCFSAPDEKILERVGYKRAAGMLFSSTCYKCGNWCGKANPLTLKRICDECAKTEDSSSWIMVKSRAKDHFLLSEKDLKALPQASVTPGLGITQNCTSTFFLYEDVKTASYAKHGEAAGLEAKIIERSSKAMARYNRSQSTGKPQKKRPKISRLPTRPADNPQDIAYTSGFGASFPCGTVSFKRGTFCLQKFVRCPVDGCNACVVYEKFEGHVLMEHGTFFTRENGNVKVQDHLSPQRAGALAPFTAMGFPAELNDLLTAALPQRALVQEDHEEGFSVDYKTYQFTFDGNVKVAAITEELDADFIDYGYLTVYGQCPSWGGAQKTLLQCAGGECIKETICNDRALGQLMEALDLTDTTPVLLVAGLLSRMYTSREISDIDECTSVGFTEVPIIRDAVVYLQSKLAGRRRVYYFK